MIKAQNNPTLPKSQNRPRLIEHVLLALCLCVLALRTTFMEGPAALSTSLPSNIGDAAYSITVSGVLVFCCVLYFLWGLFRSSLSYRVTSIEIGLLVFCAASIVSSFAAADKRMAVINVVTLLSAPLMAVLLSQVLDTQLKVRLVLCVIAALGVVSTCENVYQLLVTNQATIEQYEQAPQTLLEPLGIEPGSFQQFLFEHRLYTGGARGFFTTRNSAGCFSLMAVFAAIALLIERLNHNKEKPPVKLGAKYLNSNLLAGGVTAIVIIGLILTKSKGSIIGSLFAASLLLIFHFFADQVKAHKKALLAVSVLLFIAGILLATLYGLKYNRLPGGTGMLVRWQYWQGSVKMYADHPFTGVGPGNFAHFYPRYKPAEALESVADPHNFLLSILTQYGPLGLIGFLSMIFLPMWKILDTRYSILDTRYSSSIEHQSPSLPIIFLTVISVMLLFVRPVIMPTPPADTMELWIFMAVIMYVMPVMVFIASFWLLNTPFPQKSKIENRKSKLFIAILFCIVLGVLLNNLIDYAIFEPGVYTAFWAILACLIATCPGEKLTIGDCRSSIENRKSKREIENSKSKIENRKSKISVAPFAKVISLTAGVLILIVFARYAWWPMYRSTAKIQKAYLALSVGKYQQAHDLLSQAAKDDSLDTTALNIDGKLYLQQYNQMVEKSAEGKEMLKKAEKSFLQAIERNKADFKNYEKLITIYELLGQTQEAYNCCRKTLLLYPSLDRLNFRLAQLAEQLGCSNIAIEQYRKTIEIEDSYRRQFKIMYPERKKIVSRLSEEKYKLAIKRLKELSEKTDTE